VNYEEDGEEGKARMERGGEGARGRRRDGEEDDVV
jgi:hypothetical protein